MQLRACQLTAFFHFFRTLLAVPTINVADVVRKRLFERLREWASEAPSNVKERERQVLKILGENQSVNSITLLWAKFGNRIEDVRGIVTDVFPSRLKELSSLNRQFTKIKQALFPDIDLDKFEYDLNLEMLRPLFHRPGDKDKAKSRNDSRRLFDLRRDIVDAIYHARPQIVPEVPTGRNLQAAQDESYYARRFPWERFWAEVHETARWHFDSARADEKCPYGLLNEGWSEKKKQGFLTAAGWVRQVARFLHYCRLIGEHQVSDQTTPYSPHSILLKPYFSLESGIDTDAKRFAFILGLLYGNLLRAQEERGVNVGANALTWLRRLTIEGKDLPGLYIKIRAKLLAYCEDNLKVSELNAELAHLVANSRTYLDLGEIDTCFFLLLGQSLSLKVLSSRDEEKPGDADV